MLISSLCLNHNKTLLAGILWSSKLGCSGQIPESITLITMSFSKFKEDYNRGGVKGEEFWAISGSKLERYISRS